MFNGIITHQGHVIHYQKTPSTLVRLGVEIRSLGPVLLGDSVAVNGMCLTLVEQKGDQYFFELSPETLDKTTASSWSIGQRLNIELSMVAGQKISGHFVLGHVDQVTKIISRSDVADCILLKLAMPKNLYAYLAPKGSVTIDGIALTINQANEKDLDLMIIPHTAALTNIAERRAGDQVNIEIDPLARYVVHAHKVKNHDA